MHQIVDYLKVGHCISSFLLKLIYQLESSNLLRWSAHIQFEVLFSLCMQQLWEAHFSLHYSLLLSVSFCAQEPCFYFMHERHTPVMYFCSKLGFHILLCIYMGSCKALLLEVHRQFLCMTGTCCNVLPQSTKVTIFNDK